MSRFAFAQLLPPCTQVLVFAVALKSYTRVFIWLILMNEQALAPTIVWVLLTGLASSRRRRSAGEEVKKKIDEINIYSLYYTQGWYLDYGRQYFKS